MMTGVALVAADIGDPDSTRTVVAIIALLVVLGLALVMLAFWLRRTTRPDPDLLAPLEVMGERSWRRGDPVWQRRRLDEVRPEGAIPLKKAALPPRLDESFDAGPSGSGFDDLRREEEPVSAAAAEPDDQTVAVAAPETHEADVEIARASGPAEAVAGGSPDDASDDDAVESDAVDAGAVRVEVVDEESAVEAVDVDSDDAVDVDSDVEAADGDSDGENVDGVDGEDVDGEDVELDDAADNDVPADEDHVDAGDMRTPIGSPRPLLDDLPEHDIDPEVLERAMAELDAELQRRGNDS
jgi:hypothetical protein